MYVLSIASSTLEFPGRKVDYTHDQHQHRYRSPSQRPSQPHPHLVTLCLGGCTLHNLRCNRLDMDKFPDSCSHQFNSCAVIILGIVGLLLSLAGLLFALIVFVVTKDTKHILEEY
jgi:hypothetical protein